MNDAATQAGEDLAGQATAGVRLFAAGAVYLAAEAAAARAWSAPAYSYARNFISDLGAPDRGVYAGRMLDSPLHTLMNLAFAASGALFAVGGVALARRAPHGRATAYLILSAIHALGLALIALVPETTAPPVGQLHGLGALMAIGGGNLAILCASTTAAPLVGDRRLAVIGAGLGVAGCAALAVLVVASTRFGGDLARTSIGVVERAAVYPITVWELLAGAVLLSTIRRAPPGRPELAIPGTPDASPSTPGPELQDEQPILEASRSCSRRGCSPSGRFHDAPTVPIAVSAAP